MCRFCWQLLDIWIEMEINRMKKSWNWLHFIHLSMTNRVRRGSKLWRGQHKPTIHASTMNSMITNHTRDQKTAKQSKNEHDHFASKQSGFIWLLIVILLNALDANIRYWCIFLHALTSFFSLSLLLPYVLLSGPLLPLYLFIVSVSFRHCIFFSPMLRCR